MLQPVTLGQTRFVTPGLLADAQGVALGPEATVLLPTVGHLVGFLRSVGREQPLHLALPEMVVRRARLALGGPVVLVDFTTRSRAGLDRVAAVARLHQGQAYTGSGAHRVRYRDAGAANGYDVRQLEEGGHARVLYDRPVARRLKDLKELPFERLARDLALTRQSVPVYRSDMWVRARWELTRRLVRLLTMRGAGVQVARLEAPDGLGLGTPEEVLLAVRKVPAGLWPLLTGLPGVRAYRRDHPRIFVEAGYDHPLDLAGSAGLLPGDDWLFFDAGEAGGVRSIRPVTTLVPAEDLLRPELREAKDGVLHAVDAPGPGTFTYRLQVVRRVSPQGPVAGRLLRGPEAFGWLQRVVYLAQPEALRGSRVVAWDDHVVVLSPRDDLPIPVGEPLWSPVADVYLPLYCGLTPSPSADELRRALDATTAHLLLLERGFTWAKAAEHALTRRVVCDLPLAEVAAVARTLAAQPRVAVPADDGVFRLFAERLR